MSKQYYIELYYPKHCYLVGFSNSMLQTNDLLENAHIYSSKNDADNDLANLEKLLPRGAAKLREVML